MVAVRRGARAQHSPWDWRRRWAAACAELSACPRTGDVDQLVSHHDPRPDLEGRGVARGAPQSQRPLVPGQLHARRGAPAGRGCQRGAAVAPARALLPLQLQQLGCQLAQGVQGAEGGRSVAQRLRRGRALGPHRQRLHLRMAWGLGGGARGMGGWPRGLPRSRRLQAAPSAAALGLGRGRGSWAPPGSRDRPGTPLAQCQPAA